jgi:hypothetical protein
MQVASPTVVHKRWVNLLGSSIIEVYSVGAMFTLHYTNDPQKNNVLLGEYQFAITFVYYKL